MQRVVRMKYLASLKDVLSKAAALPKPNAAMDVAKSTREAFKRKLAKPPSPLGKITTDATPGFAGIKPPKVNMPGQVTMMSKVNA
jgi:hypothetical protein